MILCKYALESCIKPMVDIWKEDGITHYMLFVRINKPYQNTEVEMYRQTSRQSQGVFSVLPYFSFPYLTVPQILTTTNLVHNCRLVKSNLLKS